MLLVSHDLLQRVATEPLLKSSAAADEKSLALLELLLPATHQFEVLSFETTITVMYGRPSLLGLRLTEERLSIGSFPTGHALPVTIRSALFAGSLKKSRARRSLAFTATGIWPLKLHSLCAKQLQGAPNLAESCTIMISTYGAI